MIQSVKPPHAIKGRENKVVSPVSKKNKLCILTFMRVKNENLILTFQ